MLGTVLSRCKTMAYSQLPWLRSRQAGIPAFHAGLAEIYITTSLSGMWSRWAAHKSSPNTTAQAQLKQPPKPQRPWITHFILLTASASCGKSGWPILLLSSTLKAQGTRLKAQGSRLNTRQPVEPPTSLHLLPTVSISPPC